MTMEEDSIEQAAIARRERLKNLKAANELLATMEDGAANNAEIRNELEEEEMSVSVKFRNYLPHDKKLQENKVTPPVLPKFEDPVADAPVPVDKTADPFINIAPKKPNWDLRRDIQKKLDKLERRTLKAMYEIVQEQEKEKLAAEDETAADEQK